MDFRFRPVFGHFATSFEGETTSNPGIAGKVAFAMDQAIGKIDERLELGFVGRFSVRSQRIPQA